MRPKFVLASVFTACALTAGTAHAVNPAFAQWNFNSLVADDNPSTGTLTPNLGTGSVSLVNGVNGIFFTAADPADRMASSDPAASDNSGWHINNFAAQGTGDKTGGVQFNVSTLGMRDVYISYDFRPGRRSAAHHTFQISTDGQNFTDIKTFEVRQSETACDWFSISEGLDLSSVADVNDNAQFAFRIVSTFAPGSNSYAAARPSQTYAEFANWRFDMVTVSASPVPEVQTWAMMVSGLGLLGVLGSRRKNKGR